MENANFLYLWDFIPEGFQKGSECFIGGFDKTTTSANSFQVVFNKQIRLLVLDHFHKDYHSLFQLTFQFCSNNRGHPTLLKTAAKL